jgi:hypothetical protein
VGPTRTLPVDAQPTPRTRRRLARDPMELDQSSAVPPEQTTAAVPPLRAADHDQAGERCDLAGDLLAPEPLLHRPEILDSHATPPEPLGRRFPEPLDAAREGVER